MTEMQIQYVEYYILKPANVVNTEMGTENMILLQELSFKELT